jgi:maltose/maltodextrin transport system permease protein
MKKIISLLLYIVLLLAALFLSASILISGNYLVGCLCLIVSALFGFVYISKSAYSFRYLFPSLFGFGMFVILPLVYTIYIAFTNYSAEHYQTYDDVKEFIMKEERLEMDKIFSFRVYKQGENYNLFAQAANKDIYKITLDKKTDYVAEKVSVFPATGEVSIKELVSQRNFLKQIDVNISGESVKMVSLRQLAPVHTIWIEEGDKALKNVDTGVIINPDFETGFYVLSDGTTYGPGFRASVGFDNFKTIATNESIRQPFLVVFVWTLTFAVLSVALTFLIGFLLSVLLEWKAIRGVKVWRSLLILPYAVPAFISILIFKGLFNPQFGEINMVLNGLFGFRPEWTTDPMLARTMCLFVNVWLGYPYMMILCTGVLQSVPTDIYEASAIDGGTAFSDVFQMTLPLTFPPMKPLLIASFAFNFNNFLLIQLLTGGAPQIPTASTAVGYTDLLVTYTYNIAFRNAGAKYGFASAISVIIFIIVSIIAYANLRLTNSTDSKN